MLLLLAGCALPPNTALRDWARTASVLAEHPAVTAPPATDPDTRRDGLLAQQEALAVYLYALGVLAVEETPLTFRDDAYTQLAARAGAADPAAGRAIAEIGVLLRAARDANLSPDARAYSAGAARRVQDTRLRPFVAAADPPVQALIAALSAGLAALPPGAAPGDRQAYLAILAAIGEGHAMLARRVRHITQQEVARELRAQEDRMRRLAILLPPDAAMAAREAGSGAVAAVVQP